MTTTRLVIGEFSRATHITVKALRHYHERGLLVPAAIDEDSGYRYYDDGQITRAQLIRRLRELDMPLADVAEVVDAPTVAERDAAIAAHLERMESELERTRGVVGSLRELLVAVPETLEVSWRSVADTRAWAIRDVVARPDIEPWCGTTFTAIYTEMSAAGLTPSSPAGATFSADFFEEGTGEVVAFVPVVDPEVSPTRADEVVIAGADLAVAEHVGGYGTLDRTYGALAALVARSGRGLGDPIREYYRVSVNDSDDPADYRTDVCWPVSGPPEA